MLVESVLLHLVTLVGARIRVDGMWSPWSTIQNFCVEKNNRQNLVICGGGVERKFRSCTNPAPQGGGQTCQPDSEGGINIFDRKDFPCNEKPCGLPTQFMWSEWSECSNRCGRGEQRRYKMCGSIRRRLPGMLSCHFEQAKTTTAVPMTIPASTIATTTTTTPKPTTGMGGTTTNPTMSSSMSTITSTIASTITSSIMSSTVTSEDTSVGSTQSESGMTDSPSPGETNQQKVEEKSEYCEDKCGCKSDAKPKCPGETPPDWIKLWELELSEACQDQPEPILAKYPGDDPTKCLLNPAEATIRPCNTWRYYGPDGYPDLWNHTNCPDPCLSFSCPKFAKCITSSSSKLDPVIECECQMGTVMKADNSSCIVPPPTTPTPRPVPTMATATKLVTGAVSKTASTLIIIFLSVTLVMFLVVRVFDPARVIHMCEEISLLAAHLCMLPTMHNNNCEDMLEEEKLYCESLPACKVVSIIIHYFFTACFMFMFLEAVHMYSMVASVVKNNGMLSTQQNIFIGWGLPAFIVLFNMCFEYDNYGGSYHCWLQMDTGLMYGQYVPIICLVVTTFTLIEAAGASDDYPVLEGTDEVDKTTAHISQRTLLMILPLVFASYVVGTIAEFEQNPPLYGAFTIINGVVGGTMFFFHTTSNMKTRALVTKIKDKLCPGKKKE